MHTIWLTDSNDVCFLLKLPSDLGKWNCYSEHQAALTSRTETVSPSAVQEEKPEWLMPGKDVMCMDWWKTISCKSFFQGFFSGHLFCYAYCWETWTSSESLGFYLKNHSLEMMFWGMQRPNVALFLLQESSCSWMSHVIIHLFFIYMFYHCCLIRNH